MNQKGLTLVEMIAVLIVLSVIATIVTPNINGSIKDYKQQLYETQMNSIVQSAKNWSADNADKLPENETIIVSDKEYSYGLKLTIQELQQNGYVSDDLKNPRDGGYFSETDAFVLITCKIYTDETGNYSDNYNYTYESYLSVNDYLEQKAIEYAKSVSTISSLTVTTSKLQTENYIVQKTMLSNGTLVNIPTKTILVTVENNNYSATVQ